MKSLAVLSVDIDVSLAYRIEKIVEYYTSREHMYSEIGNRIGKIEDLVSIEGTTSSTNEENLSVRVDLTSLAASQKKTLYNSLPNGYPMENKVITSVYGRCKHPVTNIMSFHNGIDMRSREGSPVFATADGIVGQSSYDRLLPATNWF